MISVEISPEFILAAANMEMDKASTMLLEFNRSVNGHSYSQRELKLAKEVKTHLMKAYELIRLVDTPEVKALQVILSETIARQDVIIRNVELSL